jgi:predicted ATPase/DNA-binding CsgD family transcriptional regulator
LVMDNCEHVLSGAGGLISELLEAAPGLVVLATSREAVGWVDEQLVLVPPLTQKQALALFRQRAGLIGHSITDSDDIAMAELICRHVHNHPLYIRLAAARLQREPLAMTLRELSGGATDKRMRWQHGPRVGAEPRHRGVSDVIAWSYDLCQDKERLLLDRLSVFALGYDINPADDADDTTVLDMGADLEAIVAVCADYPVPAYGRERVYDGAAAGVRVTEEDIEPLLDRLVDRSLVSVHITPTTVRYSLLESICIFARQRLQQRSTSEIDEPARLAARHRRYYRDKIAQAAMTWCSPAEEDLLDWTRAAWDNILTAIETSTTTPEEGAIGLEISSGLMALRAPLFTGKIRDTRRLAERTLQATHALTPQLVDLQTSVMAQLGWIALNQGEHDHAEQMLNDCILGCIPDPKVRLHWRQAPDCDIGLPANVELVWGTELMMHRDPRAITVLARAREKFRSHGDRGGEAVSELFEAFAAGFLGSQQQAQEIGRRNLERATTSGARWLQSWAELAWAITLTRHGDPAAALAIGRTGLAHQLVRHDLWGAVWAVHIRAWSLAQIITDLVAAGATDRPRLEAMATEIAQLAGGAKSLRIRLGVNLDEVGPFADETNKAVDLARQVLGQAPFAAAESAGSRLRPEMSEVQRLALGNLSIDKLSTDHPARKDSPSHWSQLSTAEQEVATSAAAGWTNSAIAVRRGSSTKTVDAQMAAVFQKLMITSRDDIIRFVPGDRIGQVQKEAARRPRRTGERPHATQSR